jgi:hypothetical protein
MNGQEPKGTASPLNADWQVAQARDLLIRRGYAVIPNGGAKLWEMKDKYDSSMAPADPADKAAHHALAIQRMAHRLGVLLLNNRQVEMVIAPGLNGLPDSYALRIVVVSPQVAAGMPSKPPDETGTK